MPVLAASISPESAEAKRQAIRDAAKGDIEAENFGAAADKIADDAKLLGDPVTLIEAGELYAQQAVKDRDAGVCEQADEATRVALDILHFYEDVAAGKQHSTWRVIDPAEASSLASQANDQLGSCTEAVEEAIAEDQEESGGATVASAPGTPAAAKKKREMKPGTGFLIGGAVASTVGLGGVGLVVAGVVIGSGKQSEVEELDPTMDMDQIATLDDEGARANMLAFVGAGIGVVGLAVGIPLIIVGAKKRKDGAPPANASIQVAPMFGRSARGLSLVGRF